jgi:hypothetical protein
MCTPLCVRCRHWGNLSKEWETCQNEWLQVTLLGPITVPSSLAHPGIPEEGMPQLCFAEMEIEVQVCSVLL